MVRAADLGAVAINQVVYAEIAAAYASQDRLERALSGVGVRRLSFPFSASWRVAKAFSEYREAGGPRTVPLPGFFIGAHAAVSGLTLLTRDSARVRTYFPDVDLVAP